MIIDTLIALMLLPITVIGWVTGFLCRPLVVGYMYGFNWYFVRQAKRIQLELLKKRAQAEQAQNEFAQHCIPQPGDILPFNGENNEQ